MFDFKSSYMKSILKLFLLFCFSFIVASCVTDNERDGQAQQLSSVEKQKISNFESSYLKKNCQVQMRSGVKPIKLVGYVTVAFHGEDSVFVNKLWAYYKKDIDKCGSFLVLDGKVRIYFPLREAIVKTNNATIISDSLGNLISPVSVQLSKLAVAGRQSTPKCIFTKFKCSLSPEKVYSDNNALVFDLGEKKMCCGMPSRVKRMKTRADGDAGSEGVSCVQNHGSNCTVAFGISSSNCVIQYDRCMDYNGFGSDCSGSHTYFVGSDCSKAMAMGHCWNEVMN